MTATLLGNVQDRRHFNAKSVYSAPTVFEAVLRPNQHVIRKLGLSILTYFDLNAWSISI